MKRKKNQTNNISHLNKKPFFLIYIFCLIFIYCLYYVILQGVGAVTAYPEYYTEKPVLHSLIVLRDKIVKNYEFTKVIFCMPWAFEDGMIWKGWDDTYEDMQNEIYNNTLNYSKEVGFAISPVGWAWNTVLREKSYPLLYLHLSDWNHPSLKGSYLMACTIFSTVFQENSTGNSFYSDLTEENAIYFQTIASKTVMNNIDLWNLNYHSSTISDENSSKFRFDSTLLLLYVLIFGISFIILINRNNYRNLKLSHNNRNL